MPKKTTKPRNKYRKTSKKKKKQKSLFSSARDMFGLLPTWFKHVVAIGIIFIFAVSFYYYLIRPYPYFWRPCYGIRGYGICLPGGYSVHGLDISHYQGNIDWLELAKSKENLTPIRFIFMKATEGGDLDDKTFARNFDLARQYGFIRGAYHFFSPRTDIKKQAEFFIKNVQLKSGDFPPVLDIEIIGKNSKEELQGKVIYWLTRIEEHYGVKPIIYSSFKFKMDYLDNAVFDDYLYWIAHYYVNKLRFTGDWCFWQHTDKGRVPGIKESVDMNVFNGRLEELQRMLMK